MITKYNRTKYNQPLPEYGLGDWLKNKAMPFAGDYFRRQFDNTLSVFGAGNVINEDKYKTKFYKNIDKPMDKVAGATGMVAANVVAPGSGMILGAAQQGVSEQIGDPIAEREAAALSEQQRVAQEAMMKANNMPTTPMQPTVDPYEQSVLKRNAEVINRVNPTLANGGPIINYEGATHEQDGIPVEATNGIPVPREMADAEVEDGEVSVKFPKEESPYIFSKRLGFADKAKKIQQKYSKRGGDPISTRAMYDELGVLKQDQEMFKQGMDEYMDTVEYKNGGIMIKPENKGKFTEWAKRHNMGVQEAAKHVMANKDKYSSTIVKRANFAKNFAKENGGMLNEYKCGGKMYARGGKLPKYIDGDYLNYTYPDNTDLLTTDLSNVGLAPSTPDPYAPMSVAPSQPEAKPYTGTYAPYLLAGAANVYGGISGARKYKKLAQEMGDKAAGIDKQITNRFADIEGRYSQAIEDYGDTPQYMPEGIDLSGVTNSLEADKRRRIATLRNRTRGLTPQQRAAVLASYSDKDINDVLRETELSEQTTNIGQRNQAKLANIERSVADKRFKQGLRSQYDLEKRQYEAQKEAEKLQYEAEKRAYELARKQEIDQAIANLTNIGMQAATQKSMYELGPGSSDVYSYSRTPGIWNKPIRTVK